MTSATLSTKALNRALLARQMLLAREEISPLLAVGRLVGLQAQQAQPPFVGLWTRIVRFEREALLRLLESRKVVRSTLMRGTLHLMTADDYLSLRSTLQPALTAGMRSILRDRAEKLDIPALVTTAQSLFVERPRTFTEIRAGLMDLDPAADERAMGYAVRTHLPLVAVPTGTDWGFRADPDFADVGSWLGRSPDSDVRPESLVLRYLAAFGPAAAVDVQTWSGLAGVRDVFDALRPKLLSFRDRRKRELLDVPEAPRPDEDVPVPVRFLPGFDNVITPTFRASLPSERPRTMDVASRRLLFVFGYLFASLANSASHGADEPNAEYIRRLIPDQVAGTYENGELVKLTVGGRNAYVVKPRGKVDTQRRWIWISPFWLGINDGHGALHHRFYVERFLKAGFHVAGIDVGTSCGSPSAARLAQTFYERMVSREFGLNRKARLVGQSNGGLIAYGWAFRHPESVDRIFGICPATDFRTWPTLPVVITAPAPGLGYDLTLAELSSRIAEFNPVDNLAPLAKAKVKILHIHGDRDELVPFKPNSGVLVERYKALGGDAELVTLEGLAHGGKVLYESQRGLDFLLAD